MLLYHSTCIQNSPDWKLSLGLGLGLELLFVSLLV